MCFSEISVLENDFEFEIFHSTWKGKQTNQERRSPTTVALERHTSEQAPTTYQVVVAGAAVCSRIDR